MLPSFIKESNSISYKNGFSRNYPPPNLSNPNSAKCSDKKVNTGKNLTKTKKLINYPTILVIEDEPIQRLAMSQLFSSLVNTSFCDFAASGKEAIHFCSKKPYSIIFADFNLPDIDHIRLYKELRKFDEKKGLHGVIIAMSSNNDYQKECCAAGANAFLLKPLAEERVKIVLHTWFPDFSPNQQESSVL